MNQLGLAGLGIAPPRLHAACLEIVVVAARGDFAITALPRQPDLDVVSLGRPEADITRTQDDDAIRQLQLLQYDLRVAGELLERVHRGTGCYELHEFDLFELVLANHPPRVLAVGARLGTKTRRVCDIANR